MFYICLDRRTKGFTMVYPDKRESSMIDACGMSFILSFLLVAIGVCVASGVHPSVVQVLLGIVFIALVGVGVPFSCVYRKSRVNARWDDRFMWFRLDTERWPDELKHTVAERFARRAVDGVYRPNVVLLVRVWLTNRRVTRVRSDRQHVFESMFRNGR